MVTEAAVSICKTSFLLLIQTFPQFVECFGSRLQLVARSLEINSTARAVGRWERNEGLQNQGVEGSQVSAPVLTEDKLIFSGPPALPNISFLEMCRWSGS